MVGSKTAPDPAEVEDRNWYFDEDGTLAQAQLVGRGSKLLECLGLVYAIVGLALGSPSWLVSVRPAPEPSGAFVPGNAGVVA